MAQRRKKYLTKTVDLTGALHDILTGYIGDVVDAVTPTTEAVAEHTVRRLRVTGQYKDRSGNYRRSFTYKTERTPYGATSTVHSEAPEYRKTHLLERGHLTRDGTKRTRAFRHWAPAAREAVKMARAKLIENIEGVAR